MRRSEIARSIGALLVYAGPAWSAQEPPPLAPPALTPPTTDAVPTTPAPAPLPENRPVLVVPGVTAPRSRSRTAAALPTTPNPINGLPALGGPSALFEPDHLPSESPRLIPQPSTPPTRAELPRTLESVPNPNPNPNPNPAPARATVRQPVVADPAPAAPRRPSGLFGRLLPAPSFLNGRGVGASEPAPSVTVEPRSDPAADAALKRRIERQIRDSLGDKLRSVDVLVVDRNVTIRAKATRFWQRRGVRHSLETLPVLTGSRARVEMVD